jgi:uncharacterized protein YlxW (UPF0749 family)
MDTRRAGFWAFALVAGLLLGLLVRGIIMAESDGHPLLAGSGAYEDLQREIEQFRAEVATLHEEKNDLLRQLLSGEISSEQIKTELDAAKYAAGFLAVEGPGVSVTLGDSSQSSDVFKERGLVHDYDLLLLINERRAAGAEAISIRSGRIEERLTGLSSVRCTGPTVVVNNTRLTAPFTIKAIGDPDVILQALEMTGGIVEQLRLYGLDITVEKNEHIEIPAYDLPVRYRFLDSPTKEQESLPANAGETPSSSSEAIEVKKGDGQ